MEKPTDNNPDLYWRLSPDEAREWAKAAALARWAMMFVALSVVVGSGIGIYLFSR